MAWTDFINGDVLQAWFANLVINTPAGMINGKIVPSVSSNNLTVAIKTRAGTDPSNTDPVFVTIGGVRRAITAALSVTINAAANSFDMGSARLATKEQDLFTYLGWRSASSTVFVAISRTPYGGVYSQFSAVATNDKYLAYSGSAPASTDELSNIGRFAATLSAGGGYTWTIPTYNANNLKHHPIYETRPLSWAFDSAEITVGNGTTTIGQYVIKGNRLAFYFIFTLGSTSVIPSSPKFIPPMTPSTNQQSFSGGPVGMSRYNDTGTANFLGNLIMSGAHIQPLVYLLSGSYANVSGITATVPHTWASTDVIYGSGEYEV